MPTIEELEAERYRATNALTHLQNAVYRDRRALEEAAAAKIKAELAAKYDAPLAELAAAEAAARAALDAARVAAAAATPGVPKGVLIEWDRLESRRYNRDWAMRRTGRRGVIEVVTADTEWPGNIGSYRRPDPGGFILRLLKKDGTPSLLFERWTPPTEEGMTWGSARWVPEGEKPEGAAEEAA